MSNLIPFQFDTHTIRVQVDELGNPWWIAKDVCDALGIQNPADTVKRLSPLESTIIDLIYDGMPRRLILVNESGLYRIIFRSDKPEAKKFQNWVFGEVLPQIRKTGKYEAKPAATPQIPAPREMLDTVTACQAALKALGCFDDRDTMTFGAYIRRVAATAMQPYFPTGERVDPEAVDFAQPVLWTLSMRLQFLNYPPLSGPDAQGQQIKIGGLAAKLYRSSYKEEPKKLWDFVKGQQRQVNGYPHNRIEVLDSAITTVLGSPRLQVVQP